MKLIKTANSKSKLKISKKEWKDIGKKAGWMKKAQSQQKWFEWEDNNGGIWEIGYKDLPLEELEEMQNEKGGILRPEVIMRNMITFIQNKREDDKLTPSQMVYWLEKFKLDPDEFFDKIQETNNLFREEQRIEQGDIDSGLPMDSGLAY